MQRVRTDCDITATILASDACISPPPITVMHHIACFGEQWTMSTVVI